MTSAHIELRERKRYADMAGRAETAAIEDEDDGARSFEYKKAMAAAWYELNTWSRVGCLPLALALCALCALSTGLGCAAPIKTTSERGVAPAPGALTGPTVPRAQAANAPAATVTISIVTTNDVHGHISQLPLLGGYVSNLRAQRAADGGAVLLLDAGDMFQGTIESNVSEGGAMVRAYRALGYDAVTLGNHEFDFGPVGPSAVPQRPEDDPLGALKARVAEANFPVLNANLRTVTGPSLPLPLPIDGLQPSVILTRAGVKLGIIGGVTEDVLRTTHAANTRGIIVVPLAQAIAQESQRLRAQGARVVIALVHAGGECRDLQAHDDLSSCDAGAEGFRLARALPPGSVDVIVAGHTHAGVAHRVNGIAIVEAFSNGRAFGRVDLTLDPSGGAAPQVALQTPVGLCVETLDSPSCARDVSYEGRPVERSQAVLKAIAEDVALAREARERPLGVIVERTVWREYKTESPLNNLVADLLLRASPGADAAFSNAGAIRIPLPEGPLRYGTVFEMFPFDNTFATLQITARQLAEILGKNLRASNGILALSGLRAMASCEGEQLTVRLLTEAGAPVEPERKLRVVTSDFLASSGDGLLDPSMVRADAISIERNRPIRDALLDGLAAYPGGRLSGGDARLFDPSKPRVRYPEPRPVQCH